MSKTHTIAAAALLALTSQAAALDYVAHAGGNLNGAGLYQNSIAALDATYAAGHRTVEVDFLRTTDGQVVCAHDWERYRTGLGAWWFGNAPMSAADYEATPNRGCMWNEFVGWFNSHPDMVLFVDMKLKGTEATQQIADAIGKDRLVVFATTVPVAKELIADGYKVINMTDSFRREDRTPEAMLLPGLYGVGLGPNENWNVDWSLWANVDTKVYTYTLDDCTTINTLPIDGVLTNNLKPNACN